MNVDDFCKICEFNLNSFVSVPYVEVIVISESCADLEVFSAEARSFVQKFHFYRSFDLRIV